jgi:hypothetical protein
MSAHEEFRQGFKEGYQSVKGSAVAVPACPAMPAIPAGKTAFQVGIQKGIAAANS